MTEEIQEMPIEVSSEATTSQPVNDSIVDWNRLRISDLRAICLRCGLQSEGSKVELINRLEIFWSEHEKNSKKDLGLLGERENKLEEKIEEKLSESLSRVLDRSLQQWTAKINGASNKKDSREKVVEVQERLRLRAFILRVAEEEGWNVAVKIPKPMPNEGEEFKDLLVKARKQAKPKEGYSAPYNHRTWQSKGQKFWSWGSRANYFTPYLSPHPYNQQAPPPQAYPNQSMFPNPGPTYQNVLGKASSKQFTCYYCGGAGHTAAVCVSRSAE
ncbi:8585_t:CDS:2, partial [Cetraspora pellucida]